MILLVSEGPTPIRGCSSRNMRKDRLDWIRREDRSDLGITECKLEPLSSLLLHTEAPYIINGVYYKFMDLLVHEVITEATELLEILEQMFEDPKYQSVFLAAAGFGLTYDEPEKLREQFDKVKKLVTEDLDRFEHPLKKFPSIGGWDAPTIFKENKV